MSDDVEDIVFFDILKRELERHNRAWNKRLEIYFPEIWAEEVKRMAAEKLREASLPERTRAMVKVEGED